jgi:hypothetical protein
MASVRVQQTISFQVVHECLLLAESYRAFRDRT